MTIKPIILLIIFIFIAIATYEYTAPSFPAINAATTSTIDTTPITNTIHIGLALIVGVGITGAIAKIIK